jgi:hypothetical protein
MRHDDRRVLKLIERIEKQKQQANNVAPTPRNPIQSVKTKLLTGYFVVLLRDFLYGTPLCDCKTIFSLCHTVAEWKTTFELFVVL